MPHDANGQQLNVGDTVNVRCSVKEIHQGEDYCNVTLETNLRMFPGDNNTIINLNAKQVFKVDANVGA